MAHIYIIEKWSNIKKRWLVARALEKFTFKEAKKQLSLLKRFSRYKLRLSKYVREEEKKDD